MKNITIIGAGKTGRGFIGRLLCGNKIDFIDKDKTLVDKLNSQKSFNVSFFGDVAKEKTVTFNSAKTWDKVDKITADIIVVSVGGSNLKDVGYELKTRIGKGQKIIVAENASRPAKTLYDAIGIDGVEIAESTVFCTTIEKQGLDISSENYPYLQYDADSFKTPLAEIIGLKPINSFGDFLTRKLYTYNSASCIIAYLGFLKGYKVYSDAANDGQILALLDKNYEQINKAMCLEFGYDEKDQKEFALLSRNKFTDKTIVDTIARNAREPQRKITEKERVVGPLKLLIKYGLDSSVLEMTLSAMLLYTPEQETEWKAMLATKGYDNLLKEMCGIEKDTALYNRIMSLVQKKVFEN